MGRTEPIDSYVSQPRFARIRNDGHAHRSDGKSDIDNVAQKDYIGAMKTKDTYVRARVDTRLKQNTERILHRLGLSTAEAIRLFLVQVHLQKGLPFHVGLKQSSDDILLPAKMRQAALDSLYEDQAGRGLQG
jgi:DNA-damage-inducible protein J